MLTILNEWNEKSVFLPRLRSCGILAAQIGAAAFLPHK
jgi:hypothetical protein